MKKEGPATPVASSLLAAEVLLVRPVTPNWADPQSARRVRSALAKGSFR